MGPSQQPAPTDLSVAAEAGGSLAKTNQTQPSPAESCAQEILTFVP